jgi:agmatine deiminase
MSRRLPAEWEQQDAVLLAWPHEKTDWLPYLGRVEPVFVEIARQISLYEKVLIVAQNLKELSGKLQQAGAVMERISLFEIPTNDTWTRDFGPITVFENGRPVLLDFGFNGWGLKFPANLDNQVNSRLQKAGAFSNIPLKIPGLILEGGSVESDGKGTILTTTECLLNPNRNPHLSKQELEEVLGGLLGADHFLWLDNGHLAGDDTDAHVDTLARLCPNDTIVHVACTDEKDEHFEALARMTAELRAFRTREGKPYRLIPLPWPVARYDEDGQRLPATYANFLIINGAVLVPTYADKNDDAALKTIGQAFPKRAIIDIDCSPLILQRGSLHCAAMQVPKGVLA